jgi:DNA-binding HxlR family transcriptional regulator
MHFTELKRILRISSNVLEKNLQLEQEGLVTRRAVYGDIPLIVEYEYKITPLAKELDAIFIGLEKRIAKWESRNNRH